MKSVLEAFAYWNVNPNEGYFEKDSYYGNLLKTICECEGKLLTMLNSEKKELLMKFSNAQLQADTVSNVDKFIYGYRLGVLMTMEVFKGRGDAIFGREDFTL